MCSEDCNNRVSTYAIKGICIAGNDTFQCMVFQNIFLKSLFVFGLEMCIRDRICPMSPLIFPIYYLSAVFRCKCNTDVYKRQMRRIADEFDRPVLCFGLRTDFRTRLFPGSCRLFEIADSITEIKTCLLYTSARHG